MDEKLYCMGFRENVGLGEKGGSKPELPTQDAGSSTVAR